MSEVKPVSRTNVCASGDSLHGSIRTVKPGDRAWPASLPAQQEETGVQTPADPCAPSPHLCGREAPAACGPGPSGERPVQRARGAPRRAQLLCRFRRFPSRSSTPP